MAKFGAYACCKLFFRDLCAPSICFFASTTLKIGAGSYTACLRPTNSMFDQKRPFLAVFLPEKKWQILVQTHAVNCFFLIHVCLQTVFCIQYPQNRAGGFSAACLNSKNSILDQKTAIFGRFFMKMANCGAGACCELCFSDLCAPTTYLLASSTLQIRGAVFKCLSEARKLHF